MIVRRHLLNVFGVLAGCGPKLVTVEEREPRKIHVARPKVEAVDLENADPNEKDGYAVVDWRMLRGLNTVTGQASPLLEMMAGTNVKIAGYMVPMDDGFQEVNEFLLVPTAGACIHTPPPPGNQIVYGTVTGRPVKVDLLYPVWAYGRIDIQSTESPYGQVGFKMTVADVKRRT
ncbi:MAG: DUF3299 domain-containing protein [Acidobacteria bacterium]|nr:DUF3299 domain-containing protein [Acidobacteriota bacterium]